MESGPESHKHRILEAGSTGKSLSTPHSLHVPGQEGKQGVREKSLLATQVLKMRRVGIFSLLSTP